jgi:hypothetical protein
MRAAVLAALLSTPVIAAESPGRPPSDWPCVQRLVPTLGAGTYWSGPMPPQAGAWRDDPAVLAAVEAAAPREVPEPEGIHRLTQFLASLPPQRREAAAALAFTGLVEEANRERGAVIARIEALTRRQRDLAGIVAGITGELDSLPPNADPARRDEIVQRRAFLIRQFEEIQRTTRYACEVPVEIEARLGGYAHALQAHDQP